MTLFVIAFVLICASCPFMAAAMQRYYDRRAS